MASAWVSQPASQPVLHTYKCGRSNGILTWTKFTRKWNWKPNHVRTHTTHSHTFAELQTTWNCCQKILPAKTKFQNETHGRRCRHILCARALTLTWNRLSHNIVALTEWLSDWLAGWLLARLAMGRELAGLAGVADEIFRRCLCAESDLHEARSQFSKQLYLKFGFWHRMWCMHCIRVWRSLCLSITLRPSSGDATKHWRDAHTTEKPTKLKTQTHCDSPQLPMRRRQRSHYGENQCTEHAALIWPRATAFTLILAKPKTKPKPKQKHTALKRAHTIMDKTTVVANVRREMDEKKFAWT